LASSFLYPLENGLLIEGQCCVFAGSLTPVSARLLLLLLRWGAGVVICLERCADLHMAQLMPLPLTVSCFSEIQIGFTFLVPAHPDKGPLNGGVCVCAIFFKCDILGLMDERPDLLLGIIVTHVAKQQQPVHQPVAGKVASKTWTYSEYQERSSISESPISLHSSMPTMTTASSTVVIHETETIASPASQVNELCF